MTNHPSLPGTEGYLEHGSCSAKGESPDKQAQVEHSGQATLLPYVGPSLGYPCPPAFLGLLWVSGFPEKDVTFQIISSCDSGSCFVWAALSVYEAGLGKESRLTERMNGDIVMAGWIKDQVEVLENRWHHPRHFIAKRGEEVNVDICREVVKISPIRIFFGKNSTLCLE